MDVHTRSPVPAGTYLADCEGTLVSHYFDPYYENPVWRELVESLREESRPPEEEWHPGREADPEDDEDE
jgi:hypothetical protein